MTSCDSAMIFINGKLKNWHFLYTVATKQMMWLLFLLPTLQGGILGFYTSKGHKGNVSHLLIPLRGQYLAQCLTFSLPALICSRALWTRPGAEHRRLHTCCYLCLHFLKTSAKQSREERAWEVFYIDHSAKSIAYITYVTVQRRKYFKCGKIYVALPCAGRAGHRSMWARILAQVVRYRV